MSIPITDKFKPKNNGGFPLMDAEDVLMPDGNRLSDVVTMFVGYVQEYVDAKFAEIPDVSEVGM